jgi:DNA polymerase delta subunit 1
VSAIGRDQLTITPTGAAFLKPGTRAGILPAILGALMSARAATRATLKGVQQQQKQLAGASGSSQQPSGAAVEMSHQLAARAAVLDGRQKALKLTANAL